MFAQLAVTTPEGVTFRHDLAGAGSRTAATAIDVLIFIAASIIINMVLGILIALITVSGYNAETVATIERTIYVFVNFAMLWGYRMFFEAYRSRAIGYRVMGLTVVTQRGAKPMFWQCAVRGLLWPVECVSFALIAFVSIIVTKKNQRLADLITGTMVVHDNRHARMGTLHVQDAALAADAAFRTWELSRVSDDEVYIIRRFLDRRVAFSSEIRLDLANRLYALIWPKVSGVPTNWYAEAVLEGIAASRAVANEHG